MSTLRIKDAPLLPNVNGAEKIPTGGRGDYAVSVDQIKGYVRGGLPQQIEDHINDTENPHQVTKGQVGLGNVDNTSDVDKPISTATQEALDLKANQSTTYTKIEVDTSLGLKADKSDTYTKTEIDTTFAAYVGGRKAYTTLALAQAAQASLPANTVVEVTNDGANNGTYQWNGTTLTKSAYDPLTQAKAYTDVAEANAKDYFKNNADVRFEASNPRNINYTTADRNLTFSGTVYVITSAGTKGLTTPQVLNLPSNARYRIEYNISTNTLRAVAYNAARSDGWAVAGIVTVSATSLTTSDFAYFVDGAAPVDVPSEYGELINTVPSRTAFDTVAKTLTIASGVMVLSASLAHILPVSVVVPFPTTSGSYFLSFNRVTRAFGFSLRTMPLTKNEVVVATIIFSADTLYPTANFKFAYNIDGKAKIDIQPEYGELIAGNSSRISFDTVAGELKITAGNVIVKSPNYSKIIPIAHSISLPTSGEAHNLVYNASSELFYFIGSSQVLRSNEIVVATIYRSGQLKVDGIAVYNLDGKPFPDSTSGSPSASTVGVQTGYMIATRPSEINFDFVSRQIRITKDKVRMITSKAFAELLPETVIDISEGIQFVKKLMYDTVSKQFRHVSLSTPTNDTEVQVAVFDAVNELVHGVPYYSINGRAITKFDSIIGSKFNIPFGDLSPDYNQPTLDGYQAIVTEHSGDHTRVYDMYDSLMEQHPSYITKESIGMDGLGNSIYQYTFSTNEVFIEPSVGQSQSKKPKVILISGIHGGEKAGIYNTYFALKEIAKRWKEDKRLEALYWGVTFVVVPISVPTAYDLGTANNHNNVNICRNFSEGWQPNQNESGPYAMSELETICLDAMMANNKDAIYFCSHHNFWMNPNHFIWNTSATVFGADLTRPLIIRQTLRAKELYPSMPQSDDYYIGYADSHTPNGSEAYQATRVHGIQGGIFEVSGVFYWDAVPQQRYSSSVATMGVEALINWLLLNVKYGCELYNSKVNL